MKIIDGKALAATIRADVKAQILQTGLRPKLGVLLVGDDPASQLYVSLKEKAAAEVGIQTDVRRLPAFTPDEELKEIIEEWNKDETVDGILIQLPLPDRHDTDAIIATMDPAKDVDGFHPENAQAILSGNGKIFPPVHESILRLIGTTDVILKTAHAVIIANSEIFSAPLCHLLETAGCVTEVFVPEEMDQEVVQAADIIVIAIGRPNFLRRELIKTGACVIDVGTNRLSNNKTVGDVDAEHVKDIEGWLSPVPGGVGPMTVALLLKNTFELAKMRVGA